MKPVLTMIACGVCGSPKIVVYQRRFVGYDSSRRTLLLVMRSLVVCPDCDGEAYELAVIRSARVDMSPLS